MFMRRIVVVVALLSAFGSRARAQSFQQWTHPQDANGLVLKGLPTPTLGSEAATLGILNPSGSPCLLASPGSLGVPVCGSPSILFTPDAPLVFGGAGGTHLQLTVDGTSIDVAAGALVRAALTGDVTAGTASNTTAFRSFAGTSVLGRAAGTSGVPTEISSTANNQVLQQASGSLSFAQLNYTQLAGSVPAVTSLTGDVTGTGPGATATTISSHAVSYAKMQQVGAVSLLGNATGGTANVEEITLGSHCSFTGTVLDCSSAGLADPGGNGIVVRTALNTTTNRTIVAGDSTVTVSNGDGVAGNPSVKVGTVPLAQVSAPTGTGLAGVISGAWDAAATTVSTGLHRTAGALTVDLSTGVAGGQTAVGGTASGNNLTLTSNTSHDGKIVLGSTSLGWFDEANANLYVGTASPFSGAVAQFNKSTNGVATLAVTNPNTGTGAGECVALGNATGLTSGVFETCLFGASSTYGTPFLANSGVLDLSGGTTDMSFWIDQASGSFSWYAGTAFPNPPLVFRVTNGGSVQVPGLAAGGMAKITPASGGQLTLAVAGTDYQSPLTFSTGLANSSGTVTANISTGKSGGQTIYGGTGPSEILTISSTTNATKNSINLGTLGQLAVVESTGDVVVGSGVTTGATGGFVYLPSSAGIPSGTPTNYSSGAVVPIQIDRTNQRLDAYLGGGWQYIGQVTSGLPTGLLKNTNSTGIWSIASASDVSTALGTGSSTGILEATSGAYGTVTVASGASTAGINYSGTTLSGVAFVGSGSSHAQGMVPDPGSTAGTTRALFENGTWKNAYFSKTYYLLNSSLAAGTTAWLTEGGSQFGSGSAFEYPNDFLAGNASLKCWMPANFVATGTFDIQATLNGSAIAATDITVTSVTGTGVLSNGTFATGSASSNDTYGVQFITSGGYSQSGFPKISCLLVLTP